MPARSADTRVAVMRAIVNGRSGPAEASGLVNGACLPDLSTVPEVDPQDLGTAVVGDAVLVAVVAGREPEAAVGRRLDSAQPAVRALEIALRRLGAVTGDSHAVHPHATQRGHVERVVDDR